MQIKLVGKVHRSGVSKNTGKQYDFIEIHYVAPVRGVVGEAAQTATLGSDVFSYDGITPGVYNIDFDNRGQVLALTPVQAAAIK